MSILPYDNPNILPADSIAFTCEDPSVGLKEPDPYTGFGSAVYLYVSIHPQNQPRKMGHAIEGDNFRWPVVDSATVSGEKWYMVRMDTVFVEEAGPRTSPVTDQWCVDLNDNLFTAGDTLYFFCGAENASGIRKYWSKLTGNVLDIIEACAAPMEMQILPGAGPARGGDILYVNAFGPRGGEPYFNTAFQIMGIFDQVDRFDIRAPSSGLGNRPGYHVRNVYQQLHPNYRKIIWNSGDLPNFTICDGINGKGDDFSMLFSYLDQHPDPSGAGVYISGDNVAEEWNTLNSMSALNFRDVYMPHSLINADHVPNHGISPFVIGEPGSMFDHGMPFGPDTIVAYGGCPVINNFDVISPFGDATLEMTYGGTGQPTAGAVLSYDTLNALGNPVGVVLSGFSFHYIRDDVPSGVPGRVDHMTDIIRWIGNILDDPSGAGGTPQFTNSLAQNYPNPFNPSTTIKYSIKERAHVSLKIYNVAGQLVKTLVNEEKPAGEYTKGWNGRSDAGDPVASGVYFYKLATKHFTKTKKMVILK
ncbi:MAG: T9SS type A sorting domain-containing protein [Candidatus Latescibacteria bacterium]|nr:T9SS type A sorting domain-containing protein [Candidatus Latescibacterota bacterium]NIO28476.1 T9SS type A sorting domain-containing protein [Candidatus Latescibacterota bacterium]NIT01989.1 T9SS type A sorting domain-containing protein [Candidatus Latescibacterota bacterium]